MTRRFAELGVAPEVVAILESQGISDPFPIQELTIPDALAGRDVCGRAKTGSGKTLAFGIPLLMTVPRGRPGRPTGLVLVPTRELALQVAEVLAPLASALDRRVCAVYGGAALDVQAAALSEGVDVVVATPGRLIDFIQHHEVDLGGVQVLVVDEADRMGDMGFLPQLEWVMRHLPRSRQTMLFSATLDGDVNQIVRHELVDPVFHEVVSPRPTVEAMEHRFIGVHEMDKVRVLAAIVSGAERALVFVRTKRAADRVRAQLADAGVRAAAIHGDLRQVHRERALRQFAQGRLPVLVATDVAARGLDIDDVDVVVHFDPPEDHKAYLHRSGRTARAGRSGLVVVLVLWNQLVDVERIQRRLGLRAPVVEMFSNDPRLGDLRSFCPGEDAAEAS
jgi:superfamily II DNA/RNA helicase